VRLCFDDRLRDTLVHVGMRLELEEQVKAVDKQEDHTCTAADSQHGRLSSISLFFLERGVESGL